MNTVSIFAIFMLFAFFPNGGEASWYIQHIKHSPDCMFESLTFVLINDDMSDSLNYVNSMKSQAMSEIGANLDNYDNYTQLANQTTEGYCAKMINKELFGDKLELEVLAKLYKTEIVVCDWTINDLRTYKGGDKTTERVFLLYSIKDHYEPLFKVEINEENPNGPKVIKRLFPLEDEETLNEIEYLSKNPGYQFLKMFWDANEIAGATSKSKRPKA